MTPTISEEPLFSHNYNNVSFARSNNNVCSMNNYFSNLESVDVKNLANNASTNLVDNLEEPSSYNSLGQRKINTIQMVRPIPKFTTFGNESQTSNVDYLQPNNVYGSRGGMNVANRIHSGSEEELHRALPIFLPSEGESTSSLSYTSANDIQLLHSDQSLVDQLNNFSNLNLSNDDETICYRQQLLDATQRQLNGQYRHNFNSNNESYGLQINDVPSRKGTTLSPTSSCHIPKFGRDDLQNQQYIKPPPLPARLHPPTTAQNQQPSPTPLTFFPSVIHQFPGRSVKPIRKFFFENLTKFQLW